MTTDESILQSQISCPHCTFLNSIGNICCDVCENPLYESNDKFWKCSTCTFSENKSDRKNCQICEQGLNPNIIDHDDDDMSSDFNINFGLDDVDLGPEFRAEMDDLAEFTDGTMLKYNIDDDLLSVCF